MGLVLAVRVVGIMTDWPPADADAPMHGIVLGVALSLPVWVVVGWVVL